MLFVRGILLDACSIVVGFGKNRYTVGFVSSDTPGCTFWAKIAISFIFFAPDSQKETGVIPKFLGPVADFVLLASPKNVFR